ncbi:aspartate/glutamate racemase family protein [Atrimonas thermophila]|uniref:aspartate/glutamate racemase family protein n=1 Tax=Atrimonas thermophila TaxID=3064161 RepID=UPI00399C6CFA
MAKIAAVYTALALVEPLKTIFKEVFPEAQLVNIVDDSLIGEVISSDGPTKSVKRRLLMCYEIGFESGADAILNTCSSVGEVVDLLQPLFDKPIFKIDQPMAQEAAKLADKIGILATLSTTLGPTKRLVLSEASKLNKKIEIKDTLARGAFEALMKGNLAEHDQLIKQAALELASEVDAFVLAQGSMARMEKELASLTGKRVFSSPEMGVRALKQYFMGGGR